MEHLNNFMASIFGDRYEPSKPLCYHCGEECSGDVTETIEIAGVGSGEFAICDDPDNCPANK